MAYMEDLDTKHVKKNRFGPMDVYPQEEKQKEDELNADFVKNGFRYPIPDLLKEYEFMGIGRDNQVVSNPAFETDVVRMLLQIVNKKDETTALSQMETSKNKQISSKTAQSFRASLIYVTNNAKTKETAYTWFKQLANNESLVRLSKKIPVFNKRAEMFPEILITLYEYQVPISRVVWYLKVMVLACSANTNDPQKKKRQPTYTDVSSEWSMPIIKFMRDILNRLQYIEQNAHVNTNNPSSSSSATTTSNQPVHFGPQLSLENFMNVDNMNIIVLPCINQTYLTETKLRALWNFTTKLLKAMLDQNLLDKQYILESLIDLLEKNSIITQRVPSSFQQYSSVNETPTAKLLLNIIFQNMFHFLQSELISRRLAYYCTKRISLIFGEYSNTFFEKAIRDLKEKATSNSADNTAVNYLLKSEIPLNSVKHIFNKMLACPLHREPVVQLVTIVHAIQLGCMQALIWNDVGDGRESPYNGSPLDLLPLPPSSLLFTYNYFGITSSTRAYVKSQLRQAETCIKRRSVAIENKWTSDKLKSVTSGLIQSKKLAILECLDKHCHDVSDVNETINLLYNEIFPKLKSRVKDKTKKSKVRVPTAADVKVEDGVDNSGDKDEDLDYSTSSDEEGDDDSGNEKAILSDREIINWLCDWATTTKRTGQHRIFYVVFLIKKRQIEYMNRFKEAKEELKNKLKKKLTKKVNRYKNLMVNKLNIKSLADRLNIKKANQTRGKSADRSVGAVGAVNTKKRKLKVSDSDLEDEVAPASSTSVADNTNLMNDSVAKKIKLEREELDEMQPKSNVSHVPLEGNDIKLSTAEMRRQRFLVKRINHRLMQSMQKQKIMYKRECKHLSKSFERFPFQEILFDYLEYRAPAFPSNNTTDPSTEEQRVTCLNLISLYYMFITCKIFSHDQLITQLISRGETFRNNLSDIKRPSSILLQRQLYNRSQSMMHLQHQNSATTPSVIKPPASVQVKPPSGSYPASSMYFNTQGGSKTPTGGIYPPHYQPPSNDTPYMAPHSVPTPNSALTLSQSHSQASPQFAQSSQQQVSFNVNMDTVPKSVPPPPPSYMHQLTKGSLSQSFNANIRTKPLENMKPISAKKSVESSQVKPMSKMASYVMNIPVPCVRAYKHERNQRFVVLYGFGAKKQEVLFKLEEVARCFKNLFAPTSSIDLSNSSLPSSSSTGNVKSNSSIQSSQKRSNSPSASLTSNKFYNTCTSMHSTLSSVEQDNLNQLASKFFSLAHFDQYMLMYRISNMILSIYESLKDTSGGESVSTKPSESKKPANKTSLMVNKLYVPKLQHLQFIFDLMECTSNIFNLLLFVVKLIHIGPTIEQYFRAKFVPANVLNASNSSNRIIYFEYISHFYFNLIGIIRGHLNSLTLWKDLTIQAFRELFKLVKHLERPLRCSMHERCILILLNDIYIRCSFVKAQFPQFESMHEKIKAEKCFQFGSGAENKDTDKSWRVFEKCAEKLNMSLSNLQMKVDEGLTSLLHNSHTVEEIETYMVNNKCYYNFVAHVFIIVTKLTKRDDLIRVANLSSELTSRCFILVPLWNIALKMLVHDDCLGGQNQSSSDSSRDKSAGMFHELRNKIDLSNVKLRENFKLFLCTLASRHSLFLTDFYLSIIKVYVAISVQQPDSMSDPAALLGIDIVQYLFTSSFKLLTYKRILPDNRVALCSLRFHIQFNTFLIILKGLYLIGEPKNSGSNNGSGGSNSSSNNRMNKNNSTSRNSIGASSSSTNTSSKDEVMEIDQIGWRVLQEICDHDWVKERCHHEGDNLLKPNLLLEPALGRKAQNLLHVIYYPPTHYMRTKQNELSAAKDFVLFILQNLNIWNMRESLLELKLLTELEKSQPNSKLQTERMTEINLDFLAKTTLDYLLELSSNGQNHIIQQNKLNQNPNKQNYASQQQHSKIQRSTSQVDSDIVGTPNNPASVKSESQEAQLMQLKSPHSNKQQQMASSIGEAADSSQASELMSDIKSVEMTRNSSMNDMNQASGVDQGANLDDSSVAGLGNSMRMDYEFYDEMGSIVNDEFLVDEVDHDDFYEQYEFHMKSKGVRHFETVGSEPNADDVWLIAPLILRLPAVFRIRVLENAAKLLLELGQKFWNAKTKGDKELQAIKNTNVWNQQPLISLMISCLETEIEQRILLTYLFNGLLDFINYVQKEEKPDSKNTLWDDPRIRQIMNDTLHIRLSLVGSMFDFILGNSAEYANWASIFVGLIFWGVVDPDNDQILFTTILDMLATLMHHVVALDPNLETNKSYQAIIKRVQKDTKDFNDLPNSKSINCLRRLMPVGRSAFVEAITVDVNPIGAAKTLANFHDKRRGFKFARKEKVSTWELIEGVKNASSICPTWYGTSRLEKKTLRYEYQQKLLARHKHTNLHKELSYFKDKPEVPSELIEIDETIMAEACAKRDAPPVTSAPQGAKPPQMPPTPTSNAGAAALTPINHMGPIIGPGASAIKMHPGSQASTPTQPPFGGPGLANTPGSMPPQQAAIMNPGQNMPHHPMHHHLPPQNQPQIQNSADVVLIGGTSGNMIPNQQPPPHLHPQQPPPHMHPNQMSNPVNTATHTQIINRLHTQVSTQQQLHQQQQQQMLQQQQQQPYPNVVTITDRPTGKASKAKQKATTESGGTTPTKKRNTTPRSRANANTGSATKMPPNQMPIQAPNAPQMMANNGVVVAPNQPKLMPAGGPPGVQPQQPLNYAPNQNQYQRSTTPQGSNIMMANPNQPGQQRIIPPGQPQAAQFQSQNQYVQPNRVMNQPPVQPGQPGQPQPQQPPQIINNRSMPPNNFNQQQQQQAAMPRKLATTAQPQQPMMPNQSKPGQMMPNQVPVQNQVQNQNRQFAVNPNNPNQYGNPSVGPKPTPTMSQQPPQRNTNTPNADQMSMMQGAGPQQAGMMTKQMSVGGQQAPNAAYMQQQQTAQQQQRMAQMQAQNQGQARVQFNQPQVQGQPQQQVNNPNWQQQPQSRQFPQQNQPQFMPQNRQPQVMGGMNQQPMQPGGAQMPNYVMNNNQQRMPPQAAQQQQQGQQPGQQQYQNY